MVQLTKGVFKIWVKNTQKFIEIELILWKQLYGDGVPTEKEMRRVLLQYLRSLDIYTRDKTKIINQALINEGVYT